MNTGEAPGVSPGTVERIRLYAAHNERRLALSFFVAEPRAIAAAAAVLGLTGALAGVYPAWLASRAPIAATLRAEAP